MKDGKDFQLVKDYVVRNFGYDSNTSRSFAICDSMISHLVEGDLDEVLPSPSLYSLSEEEKKQVLRLNLSIKSRQFKSNVIQTLVEFYTQLGFYNLMHNLVDNYYYHTQYH